MNEVVNKEDNKEKILFGNITLNEFLSEIYRRVSDDREKAITVFDNIAKRFNEDEDVFLIGGRAAPYLEIAHKSTDNLIKLFGFLQKNVSESSENNNFTHDLLDMLDKMNINPGYGGIGTDTISARKEIKDIEVKSKEEDVDSLMQHIGENVIKVDMNITEEDKLRFVE